MKFKDIKLMWVINITRPVLAVGSLRVARVCFEDDPAAAAVGDKQKLLKI